VSGKYYTVSLAYPGNVRISVYKGNGVLEYYTIENDYNEIGYCSCLEDMGYVRKDALEVVGNGAD
jgi:hypothetical protein